MSEIVIGSTYRGIFEEEVEVVAIFPLHGEILYAFSDGSLGFRHSAEEFLEEFYLEEKVAGWLTVVRDGDFGTYFLDVVHVTKENAERAFYRDNAEEYELVGFQYVEWDREIGTS